MDVMMYVSLRFCAQLANQVENSSGVAMFYVVAMVASNMNGLLGEKDCDLEILL